MPRRKPGEGGLIPEGTGPVVQGTLKAATEAPGRCLPLQGQGPARRSSGHPKRKTVRATAPVPLSSGSLAHASAGRRMPPWLSSTARPDATPSPRSASGYRTRWLQRDPLFIHRPMTSARRRTSSAFERRPRPCFSWAAHAAWLGARPHHFTGISAHARHPAAGRLARETSLGRHVRLVQAMPRGGGVAA